MPREALLTWVQAEATPSHEPTVVELTPTSLRSKIAVYSVTVATAGPAPVPTFATWTALGHMDGHSTVQIQRVFTPAAWTAAVATGQVSDPGVTAREVDAEVTVHTVVVGKPRTQRWSVALLMNLEGPPTRDGYGFVTLVDFREVAG
ncbi:MAG: hypothetical protein ACRDPG_14380 [Nocardioidaceae bacterium]